MGESSHADYKLLAQARNILALHASRCPLHPFTNYSGCEDHLGEYRRVMEDISKRLKDKGEKGITER